MATRLKNSTATLAATGWVGGILPNTSDIVFYGTDVGALSSLTAWDDTSANCSAFHLSTAYPHAAWTMTDASTGANFNVANNTEKVDGVYSLYIAAGKTFSMNRGLRVDGQFDDLHKFYIDGALILNPNSTTGFIRSRDDQGNLRIEKYGTGYMWIARTQSGAAGFLYYYGGYTIRDGEIRLGGNTSDFPLGRTQNTVTDNRLIFNIATSGADPVLRFVVDSGSTRIVPNNVLMTTRGRIMVDSGFTATMQGTATGTEVLTVGPTALPATFGNLIWENNISCPLNVTGTLSMGASLNLTGSTLTGTGTVAMNSGTISCDAPSFTGPVTGTFTYNAAGGRTFGGDAQGSVTVTGGTLTATASNSGSIANISGGAGVTLSSNGAFTGAPTDYTFIGFSPSTGAATLRLQGPTVSFPRNIGFGYGSSVRLAQGATLTAQNLVINSGPDTATELTVEDATINTFTGSYISDINSGSDNISAAADGTLVMSGSINGIKAGRRWNLNGSGSGYTGTIKLTGVGFTGAASASLKRGKLVMERAGTIGLAGGLTIDANATLAFATPNAAYAAQLSGNVTLLADSTMKFGTA